MKDIIKIFKSPEGDVYHITLSENHGVLSPNVIEALGDVNVAGVDLRRLLGNHVTGQKVLSVLAETIADFFLQNENVIICYYCDFLSVIPNTSKNTMPPQEYRSRLFERMFQRYIKLHGIGNIRLSVVEINGINEKYFFHVIYREDHSMLASMIGNDLKEGFGK
ncbi:MAG: hypothetical protein IKY01_01715 [Prevotella sp.]|nr:hypothetical protein [Prevotella sp.]